MAVTNRVTMREFPDADQAIEYYQESDKSFDLETPPGHGWRLEHSFIGNNVIYFVWKKGGIKFDGGLVHYWTGYADDIVNETIGNGTRLVMDNVTGQSSTSIDANFIHADTYLYGGTITTDNGEFGNEIIIEYFANGTTLTEDATNGDVIIDNGLVKPSESGTHTIDTFGLIPQENGDWNYNDENGLVANLGNGKYILSTVDVLLTRPVNGIPITGLNGEEQTVIGGNGIQLLKGGYFKFTTVNHSDTNWKAYLYMHMCRNATI